MTKLATKLARATKLTRGARAVLLAMIMTIGLVIGPFGLPAPTASAIPVAEPCGRSDLALVKTVPFTRDRKTLDYATMKVWRVTGAQGWYCVAVGSEYKRQVWMAASFCNLRSGRWSCGRGHDYISLGTAYSFTENVKLRSDARTAQTYRLRTAAGNYYYTSTGWLYG